MNILVIGTGYVGLVSGACFADAGQNVTCLDIDESKIEMIKKGILPIYEPGLEEVVSRNINAGRLHFTTSYKEIAKNEVVFLAVGTPPKEDGSADLQYVLAAAQQLAENMERYTVIVNKSTVPIGTGKKVKEVIQKILNKRGKNIEFDIVSNPEFLREGVAVNDFMKPDRIVIGTESEKAKEIMGRVYNTPGSNKQNILYTNIESAEMIKYASNSFLATKISFINEIASLCEKVGADASVVAKGVGMDHRIGKVSLYPGAGYGGSCFPKDVKALIRIGKENGCEMQIIESAEKVNNNQRLRMVEKIEKNFSGLNGKVFAVLGLAFKPQTDDIRDAPSVTIIKELIARGARVRVFDPVAMPNAKKFALENHSVYYASDEYDAADGADALVIVTEWKQFSGLDTEKIKTLLKKPVIFDFRNIFDKEIIESSGFKYFGVGK